MTPDISVQLYSVRDDATQDYAGTLKKIADMGFGHVELAGFPGTTPEAGVKVIQDLGLKASSMHGKLPLGDDQNEVIELAQSLGMKAIITGCAPTGKEGFESADAIKATAELYTQAAEVAARHGMQVGYHNHDWEMADIDGRPAYDIFFENTPETVLWEADIYWVMVGKRDPVEFINHIGPRGKFLHFKDGLAEPRGSFRPAGQGEVPLLEASKVATHAEVICVELDRYDGVMMEAVEQSYDFLTGQGIAKGVK